MSRITTARGAAVIAAVAVSALALTACTGSGGGGGDERRCRRHLEARHRHWTRTRPRSGYDPCDTAAASACSSRASRLAVRSRRERPGRSRPRDDFEYNEDQTQLTLDLDTSATFEDGIDAQRRARRRQNLDARGNPDLSAYNGFAAGGQNEIVDVIVVDEDTATLVFTEPKPGFEANLVLPAGAIVGPAGAADRSSLDSTPDGSGPLDRRRRRHRQGQLLPPREEGRQRGSR